MWISHKSGVVFTVLALCHIASLQPVIRGCDPGWFGPKCQYINHCASPGCDLDVAHVNDSRCAPGWFGPGCQWVDLVANCRMFGRPATGGIYAPLNNLGQACLTDLPANNSLLEILVDLERPYIITWVRLHVSRRAPDAVYEIAAVIQEHNGTSQKLGCRQFRATTTVVDIFCKPDLATKGVLISGPAVGAVCSVFVSGGRNVALKQETWQSTTDEHNDVPLESRLAVDGNTNGYLRNTQKSCSSTEATKNSTPTWGIIFNAPKRIYQFVLHNRDVMPLLIRLKGFTLTCYGEDDAVLFSYTDTEDTPLKEYVVLAKVAIQPVKSIQIQAAKQLNQDNTTYAKLSLCEVEVFGDSLCPLGTFGFECEHKCRCPPGNETCHGGGDGCLSVGIVSQCQNQCQGGLNMQDQTATTEIGLFVWVGIGIGVLAIIVIVVVAVAIWFRRRATKGNYDKPHVYDVTRSSNREYNHEYNVLFRPDNTSSDETRLKTTVSSHTDKQSQIYDEIDHQYLEFK